MKPSFVISALLLAAVLLSCGGEPQTTQQTEEPPIAEAKPTVVLDLKKDARLIGPPKSAEQLEIEAARDRIASAGENILIGYWVGDFGKNKINITLVDVTLPSGPASGFSVCAGNYRPLKGDVAEVMPGVYDFTMKEPGDNRYDGTFSFTVDTHKRSLDGNWKPFKQEGNAAKNYELTKRTFYYNPQSGMFPQTSTKRLEVEDVHNYTSEDLRLMRNEIYARHGYNFKQKDMRYYFEEQPWYMPVSIDVRGELTDIELQNIDLIYQYEEYYEEFYDDFGR